MYEHEQNGEREPGEHAPPNGSERRQVDPPPTFEHPLFSDVTMEREPVYLGFRRRGPDGAVLDYPGEIGAKDVDNWGLVVDWWGGGDYQVSARDKHHRMICWFPASGFKRFDGASKALVKPGSGTAQVAAPSTPAAPAEAMFTRQDLEFAKLQAKVEAMEAQRGQPQGGGSGIESMLSMMKIGADKEAALAESRAKVEIAQANARVAEAEAAAKRAEAAAARAADEQREMLKLLLGKEKDPIGQFTALMALVKEHAPAAPAAPAPDVFEVAEKIQKLTGGKSDSGGEVRAIADVAGSFVTAMTSLGQGELELKKVEAQARKPEPERPRGPTNAEIDAEVERRVAAQLAARAAAHSAAVPAAPAPPVPPAAPVPPAQPVVEVQQAAPAPVPVAPEAPAPLPVVPDLEPPSPAVERAEVVALVAVDNVPAPPAPEASEFLQAGLMLGVLKRMPVPERLKAIQGLPGVGGGPFVGTLSGILDQMSEPELQGMVTGIPKVAILALAAMKKQMNGAATTARGA